MAEDEAFFSSADASRIPVLLKTFTDLDDNDDGYISWSEAQPIFGKSSLKPIVLKKLWMFSNREGGHGTLNQDEFVLVNFLATYAEKGGSTNDDALKAFADQVMAAIKNYRANVSSRGTQLEAEAKAVIEETMAAMAAITHEDDNAIKFSSQDAAKVAEFLKQFRQLDDNDDGSISWQEAQPVLSKSGLTSKMLLKLWMVANKEGHGGTLNKDEFVLVMFLVQYAEQGGDMRDDALREFCDYIRQAYSHYNTKRARGSSVMMEAGLANQLAGVSPGETSLVACTGNLIKNIVGSSVLTLASGVAAFSDSPTSLAPSLLFGFVFAMLSAFCFSILGRTCGMTAAKSYAQIWERTMGTGSAWFISCILIFKTWSAAMIYSMIIGDLLTDLCITAGITHLAGVEMSRTLVLLISHLVVILPLCMLRSFTSLSYSSYSGLAGLLYTAIFMTIRWADGSYAEGGEFNNSTSPTIMFTAGNHSAHSDSEPFDVKGTFPLKALVLISILTNSYHCHYNAPKFYRELKDCTPDRWSTLVYGAFTAAFLINAIFMVAGFMTFGRFCKGIILNNYAHDDSLATFSRFTIAISIICGYPLFVEGFRTCVFEMCKVQNPEQDQKDQVAIFTIFMACAAAMMFTDAGLVTAVLGALLGSFIVYVFPCWMFRAMRRKELEQYPDEDIGSDYHAAGTLSVVGALLGVVGAVVVIFRE